MKFALLALGFLATASAQAWAGPCDTDLPALQAAAAKAELPPDVKAQLQDMQAQAEKLCAAGNEEEAADVISEASAVLTEQ